jgi:hypothetical protein
MAAHAQLESARVETILHTIGSLEVHPDAEFDTPGAGCGCLLDLDVTSMTLSTRPSAPRRSAARARKSINLCSEVSGSLRQINKTISTIKRHRKTRHAQLRVATQDDEELLSLYRAGREIGNGQGVCPVCLVVVRGDEDVIEAHVDSCLAYEARLREESEALEREQREAYVDVDSWEDAEDGEGETRIRIARPDGLRNIGFHVRERGQQDVEEDIDVDGDEEVLFGDAQFTENDVITRTNSTGGISEESSLTEEEVDHIDGEDVDGKSLRVLVSRGGFTKARQSLTPAEATIEETVTGDLNQAEIAVLAARRTGKPSELVLALEAKIKLLVSRWPSMIYCRSSGELRSSCAYRHQHRRCAAYVSIHTEIRLCPQAVGIHAAVNAGYVASDRRSSVPCANASQPPLSSEGCTCSVVDTAATSSLSSPYIYIDLMPFRTYGS